LRGSLQEKQEISEAKKKLLVVSNSSVIIALTKVCSLDLLEKLFRKVIVPEAVGRRRLLRVSLAVRRY